MKLLSENELDVAAACLQQGGLVAFPTETVYGLGANAFMPIAVAGIFEAKKRPSFDPLIVHVAELKQVYELFETPVNDAVALLASQFWPGPLTIVHRKSDIVPAIVTSDLDAVGVRIPSHPIAQRLLTLAGVPVAAPSANRFGHLSPTTSKHVVKQKMAIDYVVDCDTRSIEVGIESTVVSVEGKTCTILRPGVITAEELQACLPDYEILTPNKNTKLVSPGLLESHYSPSKPLYFLENNTICLPHSGVILHSQNENIPHAVKVLYTSVTGNLLEVAVNLFSTLHAMEEDTEIKQIYIAKTNTKGIGHAIMDRLTKATFQYKAE